MSAREREAQAMRGRLAAAIAAVNTLDASWGVRADSVRQDAEARHGVAYPVAVEDADPVLMDDPEYAAALDAGEGARSGQAGAARRYGQLQPGRGERRSMQQDGGGPVWPGLRPPSCSSQ
jgi:hypothetical protein